ncbi:PilZ domain-containing protein [Desulfuromusa kysingii]|uniref:PilZ domain-containing protein n=1 Tax=Desulfuromusa kysingii TaxID=37625 RepID=A0A1H4DI94_9BACT|nr:PilZ domain-containing protein [Desulfuromusa kysingii]SEA71962.1 PilZ domain-containing protein [Desulfuromusa kysingii]
MTEQRDYRRLNFRTESDITINDAVYRCDIVDLALQGALFRSELQLPIPLGAKVPLSIYLPETSMRMQFIGELIHQHGNFYGFIFVSAEDQSLAHLRRLLELNFGDAESTEQEFSHWLRKSSS